MREIEVEFTADCGTAILAGRKTEARWVVRRPNQPSPFGEPGDRLSLRDSRRIVLEVEEVWRERLQDITDHGVAAEGDAADLAAAERRAGFAAWWDRLHQHSGGRWADNPEVWVVRFRRVEP